MARALIVGCGCRGRALGGRLLEAGWAVRGTSRRPDGLEAIGAAGIEPAAADPDRLGTVLEQVGDATAVIWLMGSASGTPEQVEAVNVERLESLLIRLVDTPVRGFVYEGRGSVAEATLARGAGLVAEASERWRIPARILATDPGDRPAWLSEAAGAVASLLNPGAARPG